MFAASSAAGATLQPVARILLFICSVQIMVTNCQFADFDGPFVGKYFTDEQCPFITVGNGQSLEECLDSCLSYRGPTACTAVNYGASANWCRLYACTLPVPPPAGDLESYNAYSLKSGYKEFPGKWFDGFIGIGYIWSESFRNVSLHTCIMECNSNTNCTCFSYRPSSNSSNYCRIATCPKPVLEPHRTSAGMSSYANIQDMYIGPFENVWSDCQCPPIRNYHDKTLAECKTLCIKDTNCTSINFNENTPADCVLRACPKSVPSPKLNYPPNQGYALGKDTKSCKVRRITKKCRRKGGACRSKINWPYCEGKLDERWCEGKKNCACCYP